MNRFRKIYTIVVLTILLLGSCAVYRAVKRNVAADRLALRLKRCRTVASLDRLLTTSPGVLDASQLAEIFAGRAVECFRRKEYTECRLLLRRILDLPVDMAYHGRARIDSAYCLLVEGDVAQGRNLLQAVAADTQLSDELRNEAAEYLAQSGGGVK